MNERLLVGAVRYQRQVLLLVLLVLLLTVGAVGEVAAHPDLGSICEGAGNRSGQTFPCENY